MRLVIEPGLASANYWRDLWRYRELMYFLAWRDVVVRYKQTAIGIAWVLLRPALTMVVFVLFRRLMGNPQSDVPDPVLVLAAVLPWQFFAAALSDTSASMIANTSLISKIYFPRLIIPIAAMVVALFDLLVTLLMLAALMWWYQVPPSASLAALPVFVLQASVLSFGLGLLLASLTVKYRDFRYVVPFLIQVGLFVSPIAFASSQVPERWLPLYRLNPLVGVIDGFRWAVLGDRVTFDPGSLAVSAVVSTMLLTLGIWYFRRMERGFVDII